MDCRWKSRIIFQAEKDKTPLKVPAAHTRLRCVAVFPPWRVASKKCCTGLKESTKKADAFSMLSAILHNNNLKEPLCSFIEN